MGKYLVTGYPGTGKSSIAKELARRGRIAYDTEAMRGYMHAEDLQSGKRIPIPRPVPRGWFDTTGAYNWDILRVTTLLQKDDDVYICALADNQESFYDAFDKIFLLLLDEPLLQHRIELRTTTDYGKEHDEMADILLMHRRFESSLLNAGAIPINVQKSLHDVVEEIIRLSP